MIRVAPRKARPHAASANGISEYIEVVCCDGRWSISAHNRCTGHSIYVPSNEHTLTRDVKWAIKENRKVRLCP